MREARRVRDAGSSGDTTDNEDRSHPADRRLSAALIRCRKDSAASVGSLESSRPTGSRYAAQPLSPSSFCEQIARFQADCVPLLATSSLAAERGSPSARRT
jgi:hypothetical protein